MRNRSRVETARLKLSFVGIKHHIHDRALVVLAGIDLKLPVKQRKHIFFLKTLGHSHRAVSEHAMMCLTSDSVILHRQYTNVLT